MGSRRREYSKGEREAVLRDLEKLGVEGAAKKHRVSKSSVSRWAKGAGVSRTGGGDEGTKGDSDDEEEATQEARREKQGRGTVCAESAKVAAEGLPRKRSRVARLYTPSQKAEALEYAAKHGVIKASEHFGMSRFSIYY